MGSKGSKALCCSGSQDLGRSISSTGSQVKDEIRQGCIVLGNKVLDGATVLGDKVLTGATVWSQAFLEGVTALTASNERIVSQFVSFLSLFVAAMVFLHVCLSAWMGAFFQGMISARTLVTGLVCAAMVVTWLCSAPRARARVLADAQRDGAIDLLALIPPFAGGTVPAAQGVVFGTHSGVALGPLPAEYEQGSCTFIFQIRLLTGCRAGWGQLLHWGQSHKDRCPHISLHPDELKWHIRHSTTTEWNWGINKNRDEFNVNVEYHVAVVFELLDRYSAMRVYVNGVLDTEVRREETAVLRLNKTLHLGSFDGPQSFTGYLRTMLLFPCALTGGEVEARYLSMRNVEARH